MGGLRAPLDTKARNNTLPALVNKSTISSYYTLFNTDFAQALGDLIKMNDDWKVFTKDKATSGDSNDYAWLLNQPKPRQWVGPRVYHGISAGHYVIKNYPYEASLGIPLRDLTNEKSGMIREQIRSLASAFGPWYAEQAYTLLHTGVAATSLCLDGTPFFGTTHPTDAGGTQTNSWTTGGTNFWYLIDATNPNGPIIRQERMAPRFAMKIDPNTSDYVFNNNELLAGVDAEYGFGYGLWQTAARSGAALTAANFWIAYKAFCKFTDYWGRPLNRKPTHIFVDPDNADQAAKLFVAGRYHDGTSYIDSELVGLGLKVVVSPYLT